VTADAPADLDDVQLAEIARYARDVNLGPKVDQMIAMIRRLREERDDLAEKLAAATRTVVRLAESCDEALTLLRRFVDDEPCSLDHDGACQAHGVSGPPCRNAEARRLLGLDTPGGAR
jgi:hypothetical protein